MIIENMIYAGSFDPITDGHLDIIARGSWMCEKLIVCVTHNVNKKHMFDLATRVKLCQDALVEVLGPDHNVSIITNEAELLANVAKDHNARHLLRGFRNAADMTYELSMEAINHRINPNLTTVYLSSHPSYAHISSSVVRELIRYPDNGRVLKGMVTKNVYRHLYPDRN